MNQWGQIQVLEGKLRLNENTLIIYINNKIIIKLLF